MATKTKKVTRRTSAPAKDNSNKPWVSNYPLLQAWLDKHEARCMWSIPSSPRDDGDPDWAPQFYVECYLVSSRPVIVQVFSNKMGWYIYTAPSTNKLDEALAHAERQLGLTVCPGCGFSTSAETQTADCNLGEKCECGGGHIKRLARSIITDVGVEDETIENAIELAKLILDEK